MSNTFWFPPSFELELGGATHKADMNFDVLKLIKTLEQDGRVATTEEQDLLSRYVGWGDSRVFRLRELDLYDLLTGEEMSAVRASTLNAHYTALPIIRAMWSGLLRLGAHKLDTLRVLDPSAGIGHFRSASPENIRNISRWVEIELDNLTARILGHLHPNVEGQGVVFNAAFEDVKLITNQFDVAISNVPFGNYPIVDRTVKEAALKANIHDYFFVKALTLLKPGGVIAFITSRYTLDKKNSAVREWLARRADLLAAVRLPDTAFVANAGTEVVTDILFLRKRKELLEGRLPDWVETTEVDSGSYDKMDPEADGKIRHNRIYAEHPEWIVGNVSTRRGMYTANEYTVKYDDENPIADVVAQILESALPQDGMLDIEASPEEIDAVVELVPPSHVIEIPENAPVDQLRRLEGLRDIYDAAQRLLDMELKAHSLLEVGAQRHLLSTVYDRFVQRFGPISNKLNQKLISKSAALPFLLALEVDYQPLTNSAVKAPIFHEATIRSFPSTDGINGCNDALLYCLNRWGYVDINKIAELVDVTVEQALEELGDKVLFTPEGELVPAEVYLIGNVREKLKQCETLINIEPRLKATIEALHKAMPKPLKPGEIKARLGSGWVPVQYVKEFIEELLPGLEMMVTYMPKLGTWTVSIKRGFVPSENTTKWGTARYGGLSLLEDGLNAKTPVVFDYIDDADGKEKRVLNKRETIAAQAKLEELKTRFDTWLWQDAQRAEHLAKIYNEEINVFARPRFDGSHLTLPGLTKDIEPRPLQKDAVWFALQHPATLVGDEVGLGKTLTAIISVMEAIRLGSAHKAMLAVPNHLTAQWQEAFLMAYPNARVLCAGKDDLKKGNRQMFMSRIATGRWDAIIVPQSSFKLLPVDADTMNSFIEAELDELKAFLQQLKANKGHDQRARKEIEKAIKRFEAKLVNKSDMAKDSTDTITWDKLGIDMLVIDEFHFYKNMFFHTKMTRIAGLPNADSQRAFDMFVKVRNLLQKQGHFIGLTGTPISNTMAEAFTLLRYFAYDMLEDMGLSHFDSWAQMFADAVMMPEMTPDGAGFRVNTRLARFTNIPELAGMLSQFMIMRRFKEVSEQVDRPDLYGGKPTSVLMPGSKALKAYVNYLAERAEEVRGGKVDPRDDNMLKIISEGRKAALDLRLLFPGAPDLATSKINTSAWVIAEIYKRTAAFKSAQLVFCDLGTPKPHKDSVKIADADEDAPVAEENDEEPAFENTYADLKAKLVARGVRADEIAFIHDAKSPTARSALFETVRNGRIRVLIGSTEKMGTGMNVQTRAIAMHHLDAPWRPADLEQRDGRLVRQGNIYPEVFSFVYITEGSFDSYVWQILETKARFIEQFMAGNTGVREIEDIGDTVLSMAEIKALASGNPKIIDRVMVQNEMMKLDQLRTSWQDERRRAQRKVSSVKQELEQVKVRIGHLNTGAKVRDAHPVDKDSFSMTVNGKVYTERREAGKALIEEGRIVKLDAERSGNEARRKVGDYRGFVMWLRAKPNSERGMESLVTDSNGGIDVILDYGVPQVLVAHVSDSDVGTVSSVDSAIRSIDGEINKTTERTDFLMREVESLSVRANEPWEHAERFESLAGRLKQLDEELIKDGIDLAGDKVDEGKDSESVKEGEEQPEEIRVATEKPAMDASAWLMFEDEPVTSVDFDLQTVLMRIDEIHASMTVPEEEEVPSFAPVTVQPAMVGTMLGEAPIAVTQTTIDDLLRKAEEARALAEFSSAVSSVQMCIDDLLDMGLTKQSSTSTRRAKKMKVPEGQLSLF